MNSPLSEPFDFAQPRFGLLARLSIVAGFLGVETLFHLRGVGSVEAASRSLRDEPMRMLWLLLHALLLIPFAWLCALLYRNGPAPFALLAACWHCVGFAAIIALVAGVAPLPAWTRALRQTRGLLWYSLLPAAGAVLAYQASQWLWHPAAAATFRLVRALVQPLVPTMRSDAATLLLSTDHFAVQVSEVCSGLRERD